MYRTTLHKLIEILEDYGAEIAVSEIKEHDLTENDINVIEIDLERSEENNSIESINEFNIFTKAGTVFYGEHIESFGDFSIKCAPCNPQRIYDTLPE